MFFWKMKGAFEAKQTFYLVLQLLICVCVCVCACMRACGCGCGCVFVCERWGLGGNCTPLLVLP